MKTINISDLSLPACDTIPACPACGVAGQKAGAGTIMSLVKNDRLPSAPGEYFLCLSPVCDVVYYGQHVFYKDDVKVRVWFKEGDPSVPVCYCKNVSAEDIFEHVNRRGCCRNMQDIQKHTGVNTGGECLTQNPAGT